MPVQRDNPYSNFNFIVEIDGVDVGGFSEADLPSGRIEAIEYREGGDKTRGRAQAPRPRRATRTSSCSAGSPAAPISTNWWQAPCATARSTAATSRSRCSTRRASPVQRWLLRDAWPARLSYSRLDGLGNEVAIETLELAYEGFETE